MDNTLHLIQEMMINNKKILKAITYEQMGWEGTGLIIRTIDGDFKLDMSKTDLIKDKI